MRRKPSRGWRVVVGMLTLAGCGLAFQAPTLRVAEVRLASLGFQGGALVVAVEVENPNRYALEGEDLTYRLSFLDEAGGEDDWLTLAEGGIPHALRIERGDVGVVEVELPFDFASVGAALGRLLRRGALDYRFSGELTVRTPVGRRRVPFDERGVFRP